MRILPKLLATATMAILRNRHGSPVRPSAILLFRSLISWRLRSLHVSRWGGQARPYFELNDGGLYPVICLLER